MYGIEVVRGGFGKTLQVYNKHLADLIPLIDQESINNCEKMDTWVRFLPKSM